jgi:hypothetical protein
VDLRAGLDDLENRKFMTLPGLELRPLGRPAEIMFKIYKHVKYVDPLLGKALTHVFPWRWILGNQDISVDTGVRHAFPWIQVIKKYLILY